MLISAGAPPKDVIGSRWVFSKACMYEKFHSLFLLER